MPTRNNPFGRPTGSMNEWNHVAMMQEETKNDGLTAGADVKSVAIAERKVKSGTDERKVERETKEKGTKKVQNPKQQEQDKEQHLFRHNTTENRPSPYIHVR